MSAGSSSSESLAGYIYSQSVGLQSVQAHLEEALLPGSLLWLRAGLSPFSPSFCLSCRKSAVSPSLLGGQSFFFSFYDFLWHAQVLQWLRWVCIFRNFPQHFWEMSSLQIDIYHPFWKNVPCVISLAFFASGTLRKHCTSSPPCVFPNFSFIFCTTFCFAVLHSVQLLSFTLLVTSVRLLAKEKKN